MKTWKNPEMKELSIKETADWDDLFDDFEFDDILENILGNIFQKPHFKPGKIPGIPNFKPSFPGGNGDLDNPS